MEKKINWKPFIIAGSISLAFGLLVFLLLWFVAKMSLVDSLAIPSIVLVSFSILMWVAREGFFDIFSYGFKQMGSMILSKNPREYHDFSGYKSYKYEIREKRAKTFYVVAIVGVLFLVTTLIVYLITKL